MVNILSIDVEDYFHPSELESAAPRDTWSKLTPRVALSTRRILDLLDRHGTRATFFVLGWVAEHEPQLIRDIASAGHEIACHSYSHRLVYSMTPDEFRADTLRAIDVIASSCGFAPTAYRAPSYSITRDSTWAFEVLAECGFTHDSSVYPIRHDRYGIPGFPRFAHTIETASGPLREIPPATISLHNGRIVPVGGGGYLRLLPYRFTAAGIRRLNADEGQPAFLYLHPWEFDPDLPRLARGSIARLRTYTGIAGMASKLDRLLSEFRFAPLRDAALTLPT